MHTPKFHHPQGDASPVRFLAHSRILFSLLPSLPLSKEKDMRSSFLFLVVTGLVACCCLIAVADAQDKVNILAFEMSRCPFCSAWKQNFNDQVMMQEGLPDILNITEWFAGTTLNSNGTFTCFHGPGECVGNKILLCARNLTGEASPWGWWNLGVCMQTNYTGVPGDAPMCAMKVGLDWDTINDCANGDLGTILLTESVQLANQYKVTETPTIFVDGTEYVGGPNNPLRLICNLYKGTKPAGCP